MAITCDWCTDFRNVQPACYIGVHGESPDWLQKARDLKQFLQIQGDYAYIIHHCPKCGHVFTKEEYDEICSE
jgi:hypothetical protein